MNLFLFSTIGSYTIGIAAIAGLVRYRHILPSYRPFIILCVIAFINEIITTITAYTIHSNAINLNLYVLVEALLYLWLFRSWGEFGRHRFSYVFTLSFLCVVWIVDNFILNTFLTINSLFRVVYSFCLIFLAINQLNIIILNRRGMLLKDARFLICIGIVIFYSYKATIEVYYLLRLNFSNNFYNQVYLVMEIVNLFVNLIFALAVLWIPRRQKFILPF